MAKNATRRRAQQLAEASRRVVARCLESGEFYAAVSDTNDLDQDTVADLTARTNQAWIAVAGLVAEEIVAGTAARPRVRRAVEKVLHRAVGEEVTITPVYHNLYGKLDEYLRSYWSVVETTAAALARDRDIDPERLAGVIDAAIAREETARTYTLATTGVIRHLGGLHVRWLSIEPGQGLVREDQCRYRCPYTRVTGQVVLARLDAADRLGLGRDVEIICDEQTSDQELARLALEIEREIDRITGPIPDAARAELRGVAAVEALTVWSAAYARRKATGLSREDPGAKLTAFGLLAAISPSPREVVRAYREMRGAAEQLVDQHWPAIEWLAAAIAERGIATGDEIAMVVDGVDGDPVDLVA